MKRVAGAYFGGALGACFLTGVVWLLVSLQVLDHFFGVEWSMDYSPEGFLKLLYQNLFWGGIAGFLFVLPWLEKRWFIRALLFSLIPAAIMLLYYIPHYLDGGMFGVKKGTYTFAVVIVAAWIWGFIASLVAHKNG